LAICCISVHIEMDRIHACLKNCFFLQGASERA
jgi:hypothetical protein